MRGAEHYLSLWQTCIVFRVTFSPLFFPPLSVPCYLLTAICLIHAICYRVLFTSFMSVSQCAL
jgi:hypothetical protein